MIDYPAVMTKTNRQIRGSNGDVVSTIVNKHQKWRDADEANRARLFSAMKAFYGISGGAWNADDLAQLRAQGRHPLNIPIPEQKILTLAGSIQSQKWDFDFKPLSLKHTTLTEGVKHWYYADKEQYNYNHAENKTLLRGLIHLGIEEMCIKYDMRSSGAICFESRLPGMVMEDPFWQTDNLMDWTEAMKDAYMTASHMMEFFESDNAQLKSLSRLDASTGYDYEPTGGYDVYQNSPETWGSKYLVIEYRWLEKIKTTRLYGKRPDGVWIPFPLEAAVEEVKDLMEFYGVASGDDLEERPYEDNVLQYATICPQVSDSLVLAQGRHPVQCGMIGFFPFSAAREMGVNKGVMESMLDLYRTFLYRESKKDDILASATSTAMLVDIDKLPNGQRDLQDIQQNSTKPDFVKGVHGDPTKVMAAFPRQEVPSSIWTDISSLIDLFDRVSPVTPALEGTGPKEESGILFEMRHAVTKLGTLILYDNWQQHLMNMAEAWYRQAQITYKGLHREIPLHDTQGVVNFNAPLGDGTYLNDISMLPRGQVVVTLSKHSPTEQMAKRGMLYDMTKVFSAHPELFKDEIRLTVEKMMETMELTPEQQDDYKMFQIVHKQIDMAENFTRLEELKAAMLNSKVGQGQAQMMLERMDQEMAAAQGAAAPQAPEAINTPQPGPPAELPGPPGGEEPPAPGEAVETSRGAFVP